MTPSFPKPGDLILVAKSNWYGLPDGAYLRVCEQPGWSIRGRDIFVAPRAQVSTFWGPNYGPPGPDTRDHMSTSGGPFKTLTLKALPTLEYVGLQRDHFWHWQDWPRAGGGVTYEREVTVWKLSELPDEGAYLDPDREPPADGE